MTDRLNGHESFLAVIPPLRDEVQMRALDVATSQRTATMERAALDLRLRVVEGRG